MADVKKISILSVGIFLKDRLHFARNGQLINMCLYVAEEKLTHRRKLI